MSWSSTFNMNSAESPLEKESREVAKFSEIESQLPQRYSMLDMSLVDKASSTLFGNKNPFSRSASPEYNHVWLLDNTAYRSANVNADNPEQWQAEFVAAYFLKGRKDIANAVSKIADLIGLDGQAGADEEARKRIEERVRPFVWAVSPARTVDISVSSPNHRAALKHTLGPSNGNGISSQKLLAGGTDSSEQTVQITSELFSNISSNMRFAGPEGWAVISDIDDTIKVTGTSDPKRVLQSTFANIPEPTDGMPEFYGVLNQQLDKPAWLYLSASPYNLYPFLRDFIKSKYPAGTIILRDSSWMYFGGLLQSLTERVQEYKVARGVKINGWLPKRKIICIGDSTQSDPESYAELYKKFGPSWIKAIYIRKVLGLPYMEKKNAPERFTKAFDGIPEHVWKVFVKPKELTDHVKKVAEQA